MNWINHANTDWYNETKMEFTITTAEELAGLAELVKQGKDMLGKTIKLGENIALNDTTDWENWNENTKGLRQWSPIGCKSQPFKGTFDGNGKVIRGVYISNSENYQGLFGCVVGGINLSDEQGSFKYFYSKIKNLGLVDSYIKGKDCVGGLVGCIFGDGKIYESSFRKKSKGTSNVRVLVGYVYGRKTSPIGYWPNNETLNKSYVMLKVYGNNFVGGLVGLINGNATIDEKTCDFEGDRYNECWAEYPLVVPETTGGFEHPPTQEFVKGAKTWMKG